VYKHTKKWDCGSGWPERDKLPDTDPIGDIDDSSDKDTKDDYVDGYKAWKRDMEEYLEHMEKKVLVKENKNFNKKHKEILGGIANTIRKRLDGESFKHDLGVSIRPKKCDCGVEKTYGKVPIDSHSSWCELKN